LLCFAAAAAASAAAAAAAAACFSFAVAGVEWSFWLDWTGQESLAVLLWRSLQTV